MTGVQLVAITTLNGNIGGSPTFTGNSAASAPEMAFTGTWFSGGSAATTKPHVLIEPTGATSAAWSTAGTGLGVNYASGFTGNLFDLQANGLSVFSVSYNATLTSVGNVFISGNAQVGAAQVISFSGRGILSSPAAGSIQMGLVDVDTNASIVAQTLRNQGTLAGGTSDQAGKNLTVLVSPGKGTGVGGSFVVQTAPAGSTGTTVNAAATQLTITGPGSTVLGNAAIATNASDGFLYIVTCAGAATGTPTANTGRVPLVYDTTNDKLWIFSTTWKQPKTPAGAAVVTWQ